MSRRLFEYSTNERRASAPGLVISGMQIPDEDAWRCVTEIFKLYDQTQLTCRRYIPLCLEEQPAKKTIFYIPGASSVAYCPDPIDRLCQNLCVTLNVQLIALFPRVGEPHYYPTPYNDACQLMNGYIARAEEFEIDLNDCTLCGYSSGGLLAIQLLQSQQRFSKPFQFSRLILFAPVTDLSDVSMLERARSQLANELNLQTLEIEGKIQFLHKDLFQVVIDNYIADFANPGLPSLSPVQNDAEVFSTFPPTLIFYGDRDYLSEQIKVFIGLLNSASVPMVIKEYSEKNHTFPWTDLCSEVNYIHDLASFLETFEGRCVDNVRSDAFILMSTVCDISPYFSSETFVERHVLLLAIKSAFEVRNEVVLQGKGGFGKTYLATRYFNDVRKKYVHAFWFNAAFYEKNSYTNLSITYPNHQLNNQYKALLKELQLISDFKVSIEDCVKRFKEHVSSYPDGPILLVYDNAEALETLRRYFPGENVKILITTRETLSDQAIEVAHQNDENWGGYIGKQLHSPELTLDQKTRLLECCQYQPLAISMMCRYFSASGSLASIVGDDVERISPVGFFLERFLEMPDLEPYLDAFFACACLAPNNIPVKMLHAVVMHSGSSIDPSFLPEDLIRVFVDQVHLLERDTQLLRRDACVRIHPLLQEHLREYLSHKNLTIETINAAMVLLVAGNDSVDRMLFIAHVNCLISFIDRERLIDQIEDSLFIRLLCCLSWQQYLACLPQATLSAERAESMIRDETPADLKHLIYVRLGSSYWLDSLKVRASIDAFEIAKSFAFSHKDLASIHYRLALAYHRLGDLTNALGYMESASMDYRCSIDFSQLDKHKEALIYYGKTFFMGATLLADLGDVDEALLFIKRAEFWWKKADTPDGQHLLDNLLGIIYLRRFEGGNFENEDDRKSAIFYLEKARKNRIEQNGEHDRLPNQTLSLLAITRISLEESLGTMRIVLSKFYELSQTDNSYISDAYRHMGEILLSYGFFEEGAEFMRAALGIMTTYIGGDFSNHYKVKKILSVLGDDVDRVALQSVNTSEKVVAQYSRDRLFACLDGVVITEALARSNPFVLSDGLQFSA